MSIILPILNRLLLPIFKASLMNTRPLLFIIVLVILKSFLHQQIVAQQVVEGAAAHWVNEGQLVWDAPENAANYKIVFTGNLDENEWLTNTDDYPTLVLTETGSWSAEDSRIHRHLAGRTLFDVEQDRSKVTNGIKQGIFAVAYDEMDNVIGATRVQFAGLLDDLYYFDGELGPTYANDAITLKLWAPTAKNIHLLLFDTHKKQVDTVTGSQSDGVWTFTGPVDWDQHFYLFEIEVFHYLTGKTEIFRVTDPYSVSLSMDSEFSHLVNLSDDNRLKPEGWNQFKKELPQHVDISVYETHMRDFSVYDYTVPERYKGTYRAFTLNGEGGRPLSNGMMHLQSLADAGLTHLHLLPVNDIGSVPENRSKQVLLSDPWERLCDFVNSDMLEDGCRANRTESFWSFFESESERNPVTKTVQAPYSVPGIYEGLGEYDSFNWGYDPFHFNVPEGSYSTNPEGGQRIFEFREMVMAVDEIGLKTVVDVVYNHTYRSGTSPYSVLDKVVPGYYHRYNADSGEIETSTCCDNTAAEHKMMEKLIIDSVILWAKEYKIDGFRFDLMGHHPKYVMENLRKELDLLTFEKDGVDGKGIYLYGEGWNFGEVADNRIFEQATQFNMDGTGVGNFNDRIRDAIRGPFYSWSGREQGFANGQYLYPNEDASGTPDEMLEKLLSSADRIRVGMAGNLESYPYINRRGEQTNGANEYIGYTKMPQESVNYIDKHDNETLWDNTQTKLPDNLSTEQRVRVHLLSTAFINYGQGVVFHQLGTGMLRSKSMDRNSYNSGDWFNRVDYTMETHNWGIGLPPAWDNQNAWDDHSRFMTNPNIEVKKEHMLFSSKVFQEQLAVRYSSPLFRLPTAAEVHRRVAYFNTGPDQIPGVIAMGISDGQCAGNDLDSAVDGILVLFNSHIEEQSITLPEDNLYLHQILVSGTDHVVKNVIIRDNVVTIPALSSIVFVKPQGENQGDFSCNEVMASQ